MIPLDYSLTPDELESEFRKLKTTLAVDNIYDSLFESIDKRAKAAASLLLAVHYGTEREIELVKLLIGEEKRNTFSNRAVTKRMQLTQKFLKAHKDKKDTDIFFGTDFD
jgi:isocitrate dehydrogenase